MNCWICTHANAHIPYCALTWNQLLYSQEHNNASLQYLRYYGLIMTDNTFEKPNIFNYNNFRSYLSDYYDYRHRQDKSFTKSYICKELGLPTDYTGMIRVAASLHDYGKIGVDDAILKKQGRKRWFTEPTFSNSARELNLSVLPTYRLRTFLPTRSPPTGCSTRDTN